MWHTDFEFIFKYRSKALKRKNISIIETQVISLKNSHAINNINISISNQFIIILRSIIVYVVFVRKRNKRQFDKN